MTVLVFQPAQQLLYHMRGINKKAKQSSSELTCIECTTPIKRPLDTDKFHLFVIKYLLTTFEIVFNGCKYPDTFNIIMAYIKSTLKIYYLDTKRKDVLVLLIPCNDYQPQTNKYILQLWVSDACNIKCSSNYSTQAATSSHDQSVGVRK